MSEGLEIEWLGRVGYAEALEMQEKAVEARRAGVRGDRLLLLEHPRVITLGRSARPENVLASSQALAALGIDTFEIRRGGDVTYHAPGQLVGYLVSDLEAAAARSGLEPDVHRFLRSIEAALIDALAELGVAGKTLEGMTGVFVERPAADLVERSPSPERKIASIGVGLRGWVSCHGFALNVTIDLAGFDTIVPCGLSGIEMTSMIRELGAGFEPSGLSRAARGAVSHAFQRHFATAGP